MSSSSSLTSMQQAFIKAGIVSSESVVKENERLVRVQTIEKDKQRKLEKVKQKEVRSILSPAFPKLNQNRKQKVA